MSELLITICLTIGSGIVTGVGVAIAKYKTHKSMKKIKKEILALKKSPNNEPIMITPKEDGIINEEGEAVDIENYIILEVIDNTGKMEFVKAYNKITRTVEDIFISSEYSAREEKPDIKKLDLKKTHLQK